jgi:hypothetical protein
MPQLFLYVPDAVAERIRARARARNLSVSRYLAQLVVHEVEDDWPPGFFERAVGGWHGQSIERPPQGTFEEREPL